MKKTRYLRRFKPILTNEEVFYIDAALHELAKHIRPNHDVFEPLRQEFAGAANNSQNDTPYISGSYRYPVVC